MCVSPGWFQTQLLSAACCSQLCVLVTARFAMTGWLLLRCSLKAPGLTLLLPLHQGCGDVLGLQLPGM